MSCSPPSGRAPLVLAGALFAFALPWPAPRPAPCPHAHALPSAGASGAHTRAVACADAPGGPPLEGPARLLFQLPIDPNRADPATLELLPGIGPARAAEIVRERERRPFARPDDLRRVHGIGPVTLARLRPFLATPSGAPPARPAIAEGEGGPGAAVLQRNR